MGMKTFLACIFCLALGPVAYGASPAPLDASAAGPSTDTVLEQGKVLYANGQYLPALDKFMKVLRRNPRQPEAREYLKKVVEQLRNKPQSRMSGQGLSQESG